MTISNYYQHRQLYKTIFLPRLRTVVLLAAYLVLGYGYSLAQSNAVSIKDKQKVDLPFPGTEVRKDKALAKSMLYLAGPNSIPHKHRFHTAIPQGWQKVKIENTGAARESYSQVLMVLQDPQSGAGTKICVRKLIEEIDVTDWMETFAIVNNIMPLATSKNQGAMGTIDELLGHGSPKSKYQGTVFRLSAIRDDIYIYYILSGVSEAIYPKLSRQLACISLYFKINKLIGPKLAEPLVPYRVWQPVPVEIQRPERWKSERPVRTQYSLTASFERKDKGVMVARMFLKTSWKKSGDNRNINEYVSAVLNSLETDGFRLPPEVSTIKVSSKKFLTGEYLSTPLFLGKNSHELWLVIWESTDAFYALGTVSVSKDYSPSVWMNARRVFNLSSESIKIVLGES